MNMFLKIPLIAMLFFAATKSFAVSCTIDNDPNSTLVNFQYSSVSITSQIDATGILQISCDIDGDLAPPPAVAYTIGFSKGNSGTFDPRTLNFGPSSLNYNIFRDIFRNEILGDGSLGSNTFLISGACGYVLPCQHTIYGSIFTNQSGVAGQYSDIITVEITF